MDVSERVASLVDTAGRDITFRKVTPGAYNTATLKPAAATLTDYSVKATVKSYTSHNMANNAMIQEGDRKVIIAADALPVTPASNDKVIVAGVQYNVVSVNELAAFNEVTHYVLQVRGGRG